jgi:hypothetical protein
VEAASSVIATVEVKLDIPIVPDERKSSLRGFPGNGIRRAEMEGDLPPRDAQLNRPEATGATAIFSKTLDNRLTHGTPD